MENFSCFDANLSSDSVTASVWSFDPQVQYPLAARYAITVLGFVFVAVGLPWNFFLVGIIVKKKMYRQQPTVVLLLNLAFINILTCVLVIPISIAAGIQGEFSFGSSDKSRCRFCQSGIIFLILSLSALNNFTLMSVDRLIYLTKVMRYHELVTTTRIVIAGIIAWLFSVVATLPTLFGFGELAFSNAIGICTVNFSGTTPVAMNSYYLFLLVVLISIPLAILIIANVWIVYIAQKYLIRRLRDKQNKLHLNKQSSQRVIQEYSIAQINLIRVYAAAFFIYIITWLPIVIRLIQGVADENSRNSYEVQAMGIVAYLTILSQVVIHPSLQAFLIRSVRKSVTGCLTTQANRIRGRVEFMELIHRSSTLASMTTFGLSASSTSIAK